MYRSVCIGRWICLYKLVMWDLGPKPSIAIKSLLNCVLNDINPAGQPVPFTTTRQVIDQLWLFMSQTVWYGLHGIRKFLLEQSKKATLYIIKRKWWMFHHLSWLQKRTLLKNLLESMKTDRKFMHFKGQTGKLNTRTSLRHSLAIVIKYQQNTISDD